MKTLKRLISLMLVFVMLSATFSVSFCVSAKEEKLIDEPRDMVIPSGYHFAGKTNVDENGKYIYYIEDEASKFGLVNEKWIYADGSEAENPDVSQTYYEENESLDKASVLPSSYDARNDGIVTSVEYQAGGTCWAHSSLACIEAAYIKQGFGKEAPDLSEYHTVWYSKNGYYEGVNDSKNDGQVYNDVSYIIDEGGNTNDIERAFMNFAGAVYEDKFQFKAVNDSSAETTSQPDTELLISEMEDMFTYDKKYLHNVVVDKVSKIEDSENAIKQAIFDFGAVKASYWHDNVHYTPDNYWNIGDSQPQCFYNPENKNGQTNHAITLVGWNDNFSRTNFKSSCRPKSNGAWLVKNSWGKKWGNYGYFWISYEDATLNTFYTFTLGNADDYEDVYMYDGMGYSRTITNVAAGANVFTANDNEYITKVSYGSTADCDYTLKIYKNLPSNYKNPTDGTLAYTQSGKLDSERYIDVFGDVKISKGERFSVVIEMPNVYLEGPNSTQSTKTVKYNSKANESFFKTGTGTWKDTSTEGYNNVCIRAVANKIIGEGNFKVKFKDGTKYENVVISNGSKVTLPKHTGDTFVFTYDGKTFSGTDVKQNMTVETHCYPTKGLANDETKPCETQYKCIFCGKEMLPPVTAHSYVNKVVPATASSVGYTKHTCSVCGDVYYDSFTSYKGSVGGKLGDGYWQYYDSALSVISNRDIPSFVKGSDVPWNEYKSKITSLNICEGTKDIGAYAFSDLTNLTKLTFSPDTLIIEDHAFENAKSLMSLVCPEKLIKIGECAFSRCTSLSDISFNDELRTIGSRAFKDCNSLIEVQIKGDEALTFGEFIFETCSNLRKITLCEGVTEVGSFTWECPAFEEIVLPSTVKDGFFANYIHLKKITLSSTNPNYASVDGVLYSKDMKTLVSYPPNKEGVYFNIPDSVNSIELGAFSHTANLKFLDMSCGVTKLESKLFNQTLSISNIILPTGLTEIKDEAFSEIKGGLSQLYISSNVTTISPKAITLDTNTDFTVYTNTKTSEAKKYADSAKFSCTVGHTKHSYSITALSSKATCKNGSETVKACNCGCFNYSADSTLGSHSYAWKTDKVAGCETYGVKHEECTVCSLTRNLNTSIAPLGHNLVKHEAQKATCLESGFEAYENCTRCGYTTYKAVPASGHSYDTVTTKATLTKNGKTETKCSVCGDVKKKTTIYYPKTFTLSATKFTYTGKAIKPTVTVKDSKGKTIASSNYTVSYSDNTNAGTAKVTIKFKGNYSGTKTVNFTITPKQVTGLKASTVKTDSIKLSWSKASGAKYYKVERSTDGKKWTALTTTSSTSYTVKKLTAGKKYQFRVTALDSTKKVAGKASSVLKTGTLTKAPTLTLKSTKSKTATASWKKVTGAEKYTVYKSTDGKKWTKVTTTTKTSYNLTKLTGGKKIYVKITALNAYSKASAYSSVKSTTVKK